MTARRIGPAQRTALALVAAGRAGRIPATQPGPKGRSCLTIRPAVAQRLTARGLIVDSVAPRGVPAGAPGRWWRITARGLDALADLTDVPRSRGRPALKPRARLVEAFRRGGLPEQRETGARAPVTRWCRNCAGTGEVRIGPPAREPGLPLLAAVAVPRSGAARCGRCGGRGRHAAGQVVAEPRSSCAAGPTAPLRHAVRPCSECPWRRDVPTGHFPPERFRALAPTAYDLAPTLFACHQSADRRTIACAGFLLRGAEHNLAVRLGMMQGRLEVDAVDAAGLDLFASYREMAEANGVAPNDPALAPCREVRR